MPSLESLAAAALVGGVPPGTGAHPLTDAKAFRFKDLDLSGNLVSWNDKIGMRLAVHQYLKRDGAEVESMGAEPGRFTMRLCFLGSSWAKSYRALVASVRADPRGQMVHPLLGTMRVACEGIPDASVVPGDERDSVNLSIAFVEDALDAVALSERFPGPVAQAARVESDAIAVTTAIAGFFTAVAVAQTFTGYALTFAAAARQMFTSDVPDPSLEQRLASVGTAADDTTRAVMADPKATTNASAYAAIQRSQRLYASCLLLMESVSASRPALVTYVVPATASVATIAATLYGADALDRIDEILLLNRVPNPLAVPAGTRLQLSTPTN